MSKQTLCDVFVFSFPNTFNIDWVYVNQVDIFLYVLRIVCVLFDRLLGILDSKKLWKWKNISANCVIGISNYFDINITLCILYDVFVGYMVVSDNIA